jgi:deoxyribonuclease-4
LKRWLGAHVSIAGSIDKAFPRAEAVGATTLQVFTKNANRWQAKPIAADDAESFRHAWQQSDIGPVLAHNAYLINLASPKNDVWEKSKLALLDEMDRCAQLGIPELVMHPGAHLDSGVETGLERIRQSFRELLPKAPSSVRLLLENTAGQGSCLGADFAHLGRLIEGFSPDRFGVCFDTCHAHAAGYDLSTGTGYQQTMAAFESAVGLDQLRAFHLNDCRKECGCRVDRHAHIGEGTIGMQGFTCLMQDQRFVDRPMIIETPKGEDGSMDRTNLERLRQMAGEGA